MKHSPMWLISACGVAMLFATGACDSDSPSQPSGPSLATRSASQPISRPSSHPSEAFRAPWEHQVFLGLADLILARGGQDLEKSYDQIPADHFDRLRTEYEGHRSAEEQPLSDLPRAKVAALYLVVKPFWKAETWNQDDEAWVPCVFHRLPDGTELSLSFQAAHPLSAWSNRKAIVSPPEEEPYELVLPTDTGGASQINVYFYPYADGQGPFVRLQDMYGECLLDLQRRVSRRIMRGTGVAYASDVTTGHPSWSTGGSKARAEIDGTPIEPLGRPLAGHGKYLGRLDGTKSPVVFVPASQEGERKIPYWSFPY